jgi:SNF2 family DNA or RNA helicase
MLERLNAGDIHGALETMGMSAQSTTEITTAVTKSLMKDLEQAKLTYEYKKAMEYSTEAIKAKAIEVCEQKIASLESRISAIQDRIQRATEQNCPICYCDVNNPAVTPCCQQLFCFPCLCESLKRVAACPLCRTRITDLKEIQVVGEKAKTPETKEEILATGRLNKKDSFLRFMKANMGAKVLMFSGYDATFSGIESTLIAEGITFAVVNGSQARINKLLREFKAGKYNVLFLNAKNMGAGLNIECATHVVLFHRMSAELETQIVGRAMRLGRSETLDVVHLLHENELGNVITHA